MADLCEAPVHAREVARLEIDGRACSVLRVDDVLPRHEAVARNGRARLCYASGEVAHFEIAGHRYAIVERDAPQRGSNDGAGRNDDIHHLLTNRELQIVQLICIGFLTKQVADRLQISEFTVRSYLKTVYAKLGVRSRGAMVYRYAQAFRRGDGAP